MNTKVCRDCGEEKDVSQFYRRKTVGKTHLHYSYCKSCHKARAKKQHYDFSDIQPTVEAEVLVMEKLLSMGIPALKGKILCSQIDLLADGCVRVGVKSGRGDLTPTQAKNGLIADVLIYVEDHLRSPKYWIALPSAPEIYRRYYRNGAYDETVVPNAARLRYNPEYRDNWGLVTEASLAIREALRSGSVTMNDLKERKRIV